MHSYKRICTIKLPGALFSSITLALLAGVAAAAQGTQGVDISVTSSTSPTDDTISQSGPLKLKDIESWNHTITAKATDKTIRVVVDVDDGVSVEVSSKNLEQLGSEETHRGREYAFKPVKSDTESTIELKLSVARTGRYRSGTVKVGYAADANLLTYTDVPGPVRLDSDIRMMFGVGALGRLDDVIDFKLSEDGNTLFVDTNSRIRAEGYLGALFKLAQFGEQKRRLDFVTSLQFGQGEDGPLNGFLFGIGYQINPSLSIVGGYSLRLGKELSPGFERAADLHIAAKLADPETAAAFERFTGLEKENRFDGLSLLATPGSSERIFPGNPIINSFNHGLSVGIALPLDVVTLFREGKKE